MVSSVMQAPNYQTHAREVDEVGKCGLGKEISFTSLSVLRVVEIFQGGVEGGRSKTQKSK